MIDVELLRRRLAGLDTTAICDADKTIRVVDPAIVCRSANPLVCGPVFTVRCRDDFFPVARAIELAAPGDVLVVDGGESRLAYGGELFARAARAAGLAGIVVDGGYRDLGYVAGCDLPVYSRHASPMAGGTRQLGELQVPVRLGGVPVGPGDVLIGDREGLVVVAADRLTAVLDAAHEVKRAEAAVVRRLTAGAGLADCLNLVEHAARLAAGDTSSLRFLP